MVLLQPHGLSLRAWRVGEVLVIEAQGLLASSSAAAVRRHQIDELRRRDARAVVADIRRCTVLLDTETWNKFARSLQPNGPPLAIACKPEDLPAAQEYCLTAEMTPGVHRAAFTSFEVALVWASWRREYWNWRPKEPALLDPRLLE